MFGSTAAASPFAPASGGLFGGPTPVTRQNGGTGAGLFGAATPAPLSSTAGGGLFGAATPAPSLFGATPAPATGGAGLFGAPSATPTSSGLFGGPAAGSSLFGAPQTSAAPLGGSSLFGAATPAPAAVGFGAPASGGLFGGTSSGGLFGAPATGGLFGAPQPAQQQQAQPAFSLGQTSAAPAGPIVNLDTPFHLLPPEHKQFVEQLDQLIERTAEFNDGLLVAHGANTDGALERIGAGCRELTSRVGYISSELSRDSEQLAKFKGEVDELVSDARHADEAFERRADFAIGAGDGSGSTFAFAFFERRAAAMRRQADELSAHIAKCEQLLAVSEHPHAVGFGGELGYANGAADGELGAIAGAGSEGGEVVGVVRLIQEHQRLIECLTANVAATHDKVEALRREHVRRLNGRDPFREADLSEQLAHKHRTAGVPREQLAQWASNQAPQQPPTSGAAGAAQPAASGAPSLFGAPSSGTQAPGAAASTAAPSLFGGLTPAATTTAPLGGAGGFGGFGAPAAPAASSGLSLFGAPSVTATAAPTLGGGMFGSATPLAPQTSFGATQFGAAAAQQPNLRPKKKSTARR